jgi:hypothetical protein
MRLGLRKWRCCDRFWYLINASGPAGLISSIPNELIRGTRETRDGEDLGLAFRKGRASVYYECSCLGTIQVSHGICI